MQRDAKQRSKPFELHEFTFFGDANDGRPQPPAAAGAAMLALVEQQLLPSFALSFYKELSRVADRSKQPLQLAWIGEDVLLLAPYQVDAGHWGGFLIAEAEAAGQRRRLWSEHGDSLWVLVPASVATAGAVMAAEGSILPIAESPPARHYDGLLLPQSIGSSPS